MSKTKASDNITAIVLNTFQLNSILHDWGNHFAETDQLNTARWQILGAIYMAENPPTVPQIAERMGITRQGALKQVNLLIEEGLVISQTNPAHQRAQLYVLTEKGEKYAQNIRQKWKNFAEEIAEQFNPDDLSATVRVLNHMKLIYKIK